MTRVSLNDIKKKVNEAAKKINAPDDLLPGYAKIRYDAHPYIEVDNLGNMFYVISERGVENERKKTESIDELLYWIFSDITFSMACDHAMKHSMADKDFRRKMFEKQEELLGILNKRWQQQEIEDHERILKDNPFDDLSGLRATYAGELRKKGYSEGEIEKLAYKKYPEN